MSRIPPATLNSIEEWVLTGCPVGHFLTALLSNDFMAVLQRADDYNRRALRPLCELLNALLPIGSYGSPAAFNTWRHHHGLQGIATDAEAAAWSADFHAYTERRRHGQGNTSTQAG